MSILFQRFKIFICTLYTFTHTPYTFIYTPLNYLNFRKTITIAPVLLTTKKALIIRVLLGIKKTETPIFQGISVVLPKLYLGGRSEGTCKAVPCKICYANHPIVVTFGENWRHPHYVPLAVPKIVCSLFTSHNFDRYANKHSLFPPQEAVVCVANCATPRCAFF